MLTCLKSASNKSTEIFYVDYMDAQLAKGCLCSSCLKKAEKHYRMFEKNEDEAYRILEKNILYYLQMNRKNITNYDPFTKHSNRRSYDRAFNKIEALKSLVEGAIPVSYMKAPTGEIVIEVLTVLYKRPFHMAISYLPHAKLAENKVSILTAFHSDTEEWRWANGGSVRIFNHEKEEEFRRDKEFNGRL